MCGIAGLVRLDGSPVPGLATHLARMNDRQRHRGPDGDGVWTDPSGAAGLGHVRLAIIDPATGAQPMTRRGGVHVVTYNGEIYNYRELRDELGAADFATTSDTEVLLAGYESWGPAVVDRLRGMFAFAIWDAHRRTLFCARDRFGIKPFHYAIVDGVFAFASEAKALLPLLHQVATDPEGLADYLSFQFVMNDKTLFAGVRQLEPAHTLEVADGRVTTRRYWEVRYELDLGQTPEHFRDGTRRLLAESVGLHLRSDVPVGTYLSGGLDSSLVTALASRTRAEDRLDAFAGRFREPRYDETAFARMAAGSCNARLHVVDITADDFIADIRRVMWHLDWPVAGPGSFPQFVVSRAASRHLKVLLGGQGGDEIFGGYVRYLVAYFEACIKAAIDGTMNAAPFVVTYESIIPNLSALRGYEPLLQRFWRDGLFESRDRRYFRLIGRAEGLADVIDWDALGPYSAWETFRGIFWADNVGREAYFDAMTHFDFKTLLPALLQVEDRMSMAHGVESRVPFLDHELVQFVATAPAMVKFRGGRLKHLLREAAQGIVPGPIIDRPDKMGFPVPLTEWSRGPLREFIADTLGSARAQSRSYLRRGIDVDALLSAESEFGRNLWALLSLELWQQEFHDVAVREALGSV